MSIPLSVEGLRRTRSCVPLREPPRGAGRVVCYENPWASQYGNARPPLQRRSARASRSARAVEQRDAGVTSKGVTRAVTNCTRTLGNAGGRGKRRVVFLAFERKPRRSNAGPRLMPFDGGGETGPYGNHKKKQGRRRQRRGDVTGPGGIMGGQRFRADRGLRRSRGGALASRPPRAGQVGPPSRCRAESKPAAGRRGSTCLSRNARRSPTLRVSRDEPQPCRPRKNSGAASDARYRSTGNLSSKRRNPGRRTGLLPDEDATSEREQLAGRAGPRPVPSTRPTPSSTRASPPASRVNESPARLIPDDRGPPEQRHVDLVREAPRYKLRPPAAASLGQPRPTRSSLPEATRTKTAASGKGRHRTPQREARRTALRAAASHRSPRIPHRPGKARKGFFFLFFLGPVSSPASVHLVLGMTSAGSVRGGPRRSQSRSGS